MSSATSESLQTDQLAPEDTPTVASALTDELTSIAGSAVAVEAYTYKEDLPSREVTIGINGWNDWTETAALEFIRDVQDAASPRINNMWQKALERIDHIKPETDVPNPSNETESQ